MHRFLIIAAALPLLAIAPAVAGPAEPLTVDYVIGMLDAGMDQDAIVRHIDQEGLRFALRKGDVDRLLEAGAGEDLLLAVLRDGWSRPRRLAPSEGGPVYGQEEEGRPDEDSEGGGSGSSGHYGVFFSFGFPLYYGYPFYYGYPYYYGYPHYYAFYYPRLHHYFYAGAPYYHHRHPRHHGLKYAGYGRRSHGGPPHLGHRGARPGGRGPRAAPGRRR